MYKYLHQVRCGLSRHHVNPGPALLPDSLHHTEENLVVFRALGTLKLGWAVVQRTQLRCWPGKWRIQRGTHRSLGFRSAWVPSSFLSICYVPGTVLGTEVAVWFPRAAITKYLLQMGWLKATEIYSLKVLEAKIKSKIMMSAEPWSLKHVRENPSLPLLASGVYRQSSTFLGL